VSSVENMSELYDLVFELQKNGSRFVLYRQDGKQVWDVAGNKPSGELMGRVRKNLSQLIAFEYATKHLGEGGLSEIEMNGYLIECLKVLFSLIEAQSEPETF